MVSHYPSDRKNLALVRLLCSQEPRGMVYKWLFWVVQQKVTLSGRTLIYLKYPYKNIKYENTKIQRNKTVQRFYIIFITLE